MLSEARAELFQGACKMTDKEILNKAHDYARNNIERTEEGGYDIIEKMRLVDAYLAGAKDNTPQWHKQSKDDIYDCVNDWDIHYFVCIMKNEHRVFATGICDEDYDGNVSQNLFFDDCDEKYNCDDIKWWQEIELPKE
jgi:hypothetical protein